MSEDSKSNDSENNKENKPKHSELESYKEIDDSQDNLINILNNKNDAKNSILSLEKKDNNNISIGEIKKTKIKINDSSNSLNFLAHRYFIQKNFLNV